MAGREFESAEEADEWLGYLVSQKNKNLDESSRVSMHFELVNELMRVCSTDFVHFTLRASGEIFLALDGLSRTVQVLTRKTKYDFDLSSNRCTKLLF